MKKEPLTELDYPLSLIEKVAPSLDMTYTDKNNQEKRLNKKMKGFCWYYVHNGGNKTDAYRRAYHSTFDKKTNKLIADKDLDIVAVASKGGRLYRKVQIQKAITLLQEELTATIKGDVPHALLTQLQVQATYDPSMFIKPNGKPAFTSWEEIPLEYRCCVESITTNHFGKNADVEEVVIKLVNRQQARAQLLKIAPNLLQPNKVELLHTTLDDNGNPTGIDYSKLTDSELHNIINKNR